MTDKKKSSRFPGVVSDDDMLDDAFAEWDKNLDSLFTDDESTASSANKGQSPVAQPLASARDPFALGQEPSLKGDEFESSLDFLDDNESFEDLFTGDPPPLLPPIEDEEPTGEGVITSAARHRPKAPREDLFANDDGDEGLIGEVTRILDIDDELLARSVPQPESSPLYSPAPTPKVRRTPSIVRRDDLERMRAERARTSSESPPAGFVPADDEDIEFGFGPEATRITDAEQLESLVSSSAANPTLASAADDDDEPEISIALDDEFYDDIEIGESSEPAPDVAAPRGQRRVSTHLLRRDVPKRPTPSPVISPRGSVVTSDSPAVISGSGQVSGQIGGEQTGSQKIVGQPAGGQKTSDHSGPIDSLRSNPLASDSLDLSDSLDDAFASLARQVDPEMTLDLRVDDLGIPEDDEERAKFGMDDGDDSFFAERMDTDVRGGTSRAIPPADSVSGQNQDSVVTADMAPVASPSPAAPAEPSSPSTRQSHAFLDLEPSAITSEGLQPVKRPTIAPGGTLERLSGPISPRPPSANELKPPREFDPDADAGASQTSPAFDPRASAPTLAAIPSQPDARTSFEDDRTPIPGEAPSEQAAAIPTPVAHDQDKTPVPGDDASPDAEADRLATDIDDARAAMGRAPTANPIADADIVDEMPATSAATPVGQVADAMEPASGMRAPNSTYDVGLPAVVVGTSGAVAPVVARDDAPTGLQPAVVNEGVLTTQPVQPVKAPGQAPGQTPGVQPTGQSAGAADDLARTLAGRRPTAAELAAGSRAGAPTLPPATIADDLPVFDPGAIAISADIEPEVVDVDTEIAAMVAELALYEREIERDDFSPMAKYLRMQAGRLSEKLGDVERSRLHYEEALGHDPVLLPALQALRRLERGTGDWGSAINYLDTELDLASDAEKPGIIAHKADIFMAVGEQDLARVVIGERLDQAPDDVRALLANLELAYVDDRDDEFDATLDRLATTLSVPQLVSCMHLLRGRLSERPVGQSSGDLATAIAAYKNAADAGSASALVAVALAAQQMGDLDTAIAAIRGLSHSALEQRDPNYVGALHWRRACWAALQGDRAEQRAALTAAASLGHPEPAVLSALAECALADQDDAAAADILAKWADSAESPAERAIALVRQAECQTRLGRADEAVAALRAAAELDPADPRATGALEQVLRAQGDIDSLVALDRQAAEADPAGAILERVRAAQHLSELGRHDAAIELLEAGLGAAPESPALSDALLETLDRAGQAEKRLALLQRLAEDSGELRDPEATLRQLAQAADAHATVLVAEYDHLHAQVASAESADEAEREATAGALQALAERRERAVSQAIDAWNRVLDNDVESADAYAALTRLSGALGEPALLEDALARAQAATRDTAHAVELALARADLLVRGDAPDITGAEDLAREAMELDPSDPRPPQRMLELAVGDARPLDAAMLLEEMSAAAADPQEVASLRYRSAVLLLGLADEPAQAAELLRVVVEEQPRFTAARDLLVSAYKLLGEPIDDLLESEAAAGGDDAPKAPDFAELMRQAETALYHVGDAPLAMELYAEADRVRPDDPLVHHGWKSAAVVADQPAVVAKLAADATARAERSADPAVRADAYEELARVAGDTQGDEPAALAATQRAVELAPERTWLVRELDKAYALGENWQALYDLRDQQRSSAETPIERLAWRFSRARLARLLDLPAPAQLDEYRAAHAIDEQWPIALFHLEMAARANGISQELADLEDQIARFFARDERARAAFATRSAETRAELGDFDGAIERFRAASELCGGFEPALFGWFHAALRGQRWRDLADAALREAELVQAEDLDAEQPDEDNVGKPDEAKDEAKDEDSPEQPDEAKDDDDTERKARPKFGRKVELIHLAGVALMDRASDDDPAALGDAIAALERVLTLAPGHADAFARLHGLYSQDQRHDDLARLLERRLDTETEPEKQASIHRALADLMRTSLGDNERARHHLRAVLELIPNEPGAVEVLSELAWAEEAWEDAADALVLRARLSQDTTQQREIFFRLGTIYADHMPNPEWAVQSFKRVLNIDSSDAKALGYLIRLGNETEDWPLVLQSSERMVELEEDVETKVAHLHSIGDVYHHKLGDRPRAERAYRRALDLAPRDSGALDRLINFFEAGRDTRAMRVHLDRVLAPVRSQLVGSPTDSSLYRVVTQALTARERAGALGSRAGARCAAEMVIITGGSDPLVSELAAEAATDTPPVAGLLKPEIDELLYPRVVTNGLRQIFSLVGERIGKHVGIDLRRYGVGRADRIKSADASVVRIASSMADKLDIEAPAVYVSKKEKRLLVVEPTHPMSLVISADVLDSADGAQLTFAVGRAVKLAQSSFAVPARMSEEEFGVLMVALLRQFAPEFGTLAVDADAVAAQQQRLRRLIPNSLSLQLRPFAIGIAGPDFDHGKLHSGIREAGNRAGLLACGSITAALTLLATLSGKSGPLEVIGELEANQLIQFAMSEDHATLRGQLALP